MAVDSKTFWEDYPMIDKELRKAVSENKNYVEMWTNEDTPHRVFVRKVDETYRNIERTITYSEQQLKTWEHLSDEQKEQAIYNGYISRLETIELLTMQDPEMEGKRLEWTKGNMERFGRCMRELIPYEPENSCSETSTVWHKLFTPGVSEPYDEPESSGEYLVSNGHSVKIAEFYSGGQCRGGWDLNDDRVSNYDIVWWAEKPKSPFELLS